MFYYFKTKYFNSLPNRNDVPHPLRIPSLYDLRQNSARLNQSGLVHLLETALSGVEATVPCFHGVSSPGHPEGRVQVVVPQGDRECRLTVVSA